MLCFSNVAMATAFPEKTKDIVQDHAKIFKKEDSTNLTETLKSIPGSFKVVTVPSTEPEATTPDEYAQKLFEEYEMSDDTLLMVLDVGKKDLGVFAGTALTSRGANQELFDSKITSYFDPWKTSNKYDQGIAQFAKEVQTEVSKNPAPAPVQATGADKADKAKAEPQDESLLSLLPWWAYLIVIILGAGLIYLAFLTMRRRSIMTNIDEVEDWKDDLLEKITTIDLEKNMRRATGVTVERYEELITRKEKLINTRIVEAEMVIIEADEACDRFRFGTSLNLIEECKDMLTEIEAELATLKNDTTKIVQAKNEPKEVIPEIDKQLEQMEHKLTEIRLTYGLSFHDLKVELDKVSTMKQTIKEATADGDNVKAAELSHEAQSILKELQELLEKIPDYVNLVRKDMKDELHQLEKDVEAALGGQYDLCPTKLDEELLQVKQTVTASGNALEEGDVAALQNHVKAFMTKVEAIYQLLEDAVKAMQKANEPEEATDIEQDSEETQIPQTEIEEIEQDAESIFEQRVDKEPHVVSFKEATLSATEAAASIAETIPETVTKPTEEVQKQETVHETSFKATAEPAYRKADDTEYELVIPKIPKPFNDSKQQVVVEPAITIHDEDDILDEMERISGELIVIRQKIKRSYLPGIPEELKTKFDTVVGLLGQIQIRMESYRYDFQEVIYYVEQAAEQLVETNYLADNTIAACQSAEGAIQYTNRYRRLNRQVNELLSKAEHAFRQLYFTEAFQLAEEARLIIEGEKDEDANSWMLRKKKKGAR